MFKDLVISLLAAVLIVDQPWLVISSSEEKRAMIVGIATTIIIFCLFCEELWEKWQNRRKRVRNIRDFIRELRVTPINPGRSRQ